MATLYEEVRAALRDCRFKPRKRLGQNFLIHTHVIDSIVRLLDLSPRDEILEIGPGLGFLTRRLVEAGSKVWAVEVDPFLVEWLKQSSLGSHPALRLIHDDVLRLPLDVMLPKYKIKAVGNLPYSISTPVLFRLFDWRDHFSSLVLMVQREVAERMISVPGRKSYGALSVWCQVHGAASDKVSVSPQAFFPRPQVRSMILKIELYDKPLVDDGELPWLRALVRAAFGHRRKTLVNALSDLFNQDRPEIEAFLHSQRVDPRRRGETLSIQEFIGLSRAAQKYGRPLGQS